MFREAGKQAVTLASAVALLVGAASSAPAQHVHGHLFSAGPAYTSVKGGREGPKFPTVEILLRVRNANGGLEQVKASEIRVVSGGAEVGKATAVRSLVEAGHGIRSILAVDLSRNPSARQLDAIAAAMRKPAELKSEQDQVEVLSFAEQTHVAVPFGAANASMSQLPAHGGRPHLFDALAEALGQLAVSGPAYRQLTVIADGRDSGSQHSMDDVVNQALKLGIEIDTIDLQREQDGQSMTLRRLSHETHGFYQQVESAEALASLVEAGIRAIHSAPVAAVELHNLPADGGWHTLGVRWQPESLTAAVELLTPAPHDGLPSWIWWVVALVLGGLLWMLVRSRRKRLVPADGTEKATAAGEASGNETGKARTAPTPPWLEEMQRATQKNQRVPDAGPRLLEMPGRGARNVGFTLSEDSSAVVLEFTAGPLEGKRIRMESAEFLIGAVSANTLPIADDPTLSGFHAKLLLVNGDLMLEDSHSTNGTWLNGQRIGGNRKNLRVDDEVRLGRSSFFVRRGISAAE